MIQNETKRIRITFAVDNSETTEFDFDRVQFVRQIWRRRG